MTAIIYFGEMLVASVLAIVLLAISQLRMSSGAALFAGGVVALTLAEYVVHRFVLHGFAPTEHRLHHANPDGPVLTIFWQIWACFALVYLIAGGAFLAGARVAMTSAEFDLLRTFCERSGRVLSRDSLLDLTQGRSAGSF